MKKRMLSLLLVLLMVTAILPISAAADDNYLTRGVIENIVVSDPVYNNNDTALTGITASFKWISDPVDKAYLILSSEKLEGGDDGINWGVFSSEGSIAGGQSTNGMPNGMFKDLAEAKAHNNANSNIYGFIQDISIGSLATNTQYNTIEFDFQTTPIFLNNNATYYCYLWIEILGEFYPDCLIFVVQVKDGVLKFAPASKPTQTDIAQNSNLHQNSQWGTNIYRNYYNSIHFEAVKNDPKNPTPDNPHTCTTSDWITNETHHWKLTCHENGIATANNTQNLIVVDKGEHVYTDGYDTVCNVCNYSRTAPVQRPATGDITHIPMWTMMFLGGIALLWVQLNQRKREEF